MVKTPAFDRVAAEGVLFNHAFCDAPTCGPSRSAILTGQSIWRLEEAGNIHSTLPSKFATYTEMLEQAGYRVGSTGKAWAPGRLEPGGRTRNPAGDRFQSFDEFFQQQPADQPFCFWLGTSDPHRPYELGSGAQSGKDPGEVIVPPHLPDHAVVRNDILDYYVEVERWDSKVEQAIALLEKAGRLDNTIVVVTSDHGMPFPRAKASLYDYGSRVPLAISWPQAIPRGRTVDDFVSLSDMAPTFLEAAGLAVREDMTARSLLPILTSDRGGRVDPSRDAAFIAMERHDGCRRGGKGYPCRAIRNKDYLYIRNFEPTRWPSGSPNAADCARGIPYGEIDRSPTKSFMMENRDDPVVEPVCGVGIRNARGTRALRSASRPGPAAQHRCGACGGGPPAGAPQSSDDAIGRHRRPASAGHASTVGFLSLLRSQGQRGLDSRRAGLIQNGPADVLPGTLLADLSAGPQAARSSELTSSRPRSGRRAI